MKNYPIEKYQFKTYTDKPTGAKVVVAISTYAGRIVRGVAKCHPSDNYDLETGKKIAAVRCAEKIARRREKRAEMKFEEARLALIASKRNYEKMTKYVCDSTAEVLAAQHELEVLTKSL